MRLLCALGRHSPDPVARWNDGYYFSRCQHCGRDVVRTAYGKWFVPSGYKVVWSPLPPAGHRTASLAEAPAETATQEPTGFRGLFRSFLPLQMTSRRTSSGGTELPISEVLRDLDTGTVHTPGEDDREPGSGARGEHDFMSDAPEAVSKWFFEAPRQERPQSPPAPVPAVPEVHPSHDPPLTADETAPQAEEMPGTGPALASEEVTEAEALSPPDDPADLLSEELPPAVGDSARPDSGLVEPDASNELSPTQGAANASVVMIAIGLGVVLALLLAVAALVLVLTKPPKVPRPQPQTAVATSQAPRERFVTASLLQCRASPSRQARALVKLGRGTSVLSLSSDLEWESVSYKGRQCWVRARYLSDERPY